MVFVIFFFVVDIDEDADGLAEHIDTLYLSAEAVVALDFVADFREGAVQLLVGLRFVLEAAHQAAADTGDLAGIE